MGGLVSSVLNYWYHNGITNDESLLKPESDCLNEVKVDSNSITSNHILTNDKRSQTKFEKNYVPGICKFSNIAATNSLVEKCTHMNPENESGRAELKQSWDESNVSDLSFGSLDYKQVVALSDVLLSDSQLETNVCLCLSHSVGVNSLIKVDESSNTGYSDLSAESTDALLSIYNTNLIELLDEDVTWFECLVKNKVEQILSYCHNEDNRIPLKPLYVGSFPAGLKVGMPNEFDVAIQMDIGKLIGPFREFYSQVNYRLYHSKTGETIWEDNPIMENLEQYQIIETKKLLPSAALGYGNVRLQTDSSCSDDITFQGLVVPWKIKVLFYEVLKRVIKQHGLIRISTTKELHGPTITLETNEKNFPFLISVDLTPSIHLPFPQWHPWPKSYNAQRWLSNDIIREITDKGVQLVAKKNYHWLISYNECENVLISHIDDDGGCRKKYHKIMKRLNYDCWALRNENDEPKLILSSYHLKNVWFFECERLPEKKYWSEENTWENLNRLINSLLTYLRSEKITIYFEKQINLLKNVAKADLQQTIANIENFQQNINGKLIHAIKTGKRDIIT